MSNAFVLARLVEKLGHRIADIRDRSMRALCRKILSPVCEWDLVEGLGEIDGVAHLFLLWINERYDFVSPEHLKECFESIARLVSRSQSLRQAFVEAGGPSFFDEFACHNPSLYDECRNLIILLVGSDGDQSATVTAKSDIPKPVRPESTLSPSEEERFFDLSVRVKFLTSGSSPDQIEELGREIRFGSWMSMDACMFLSKPYLIEAVCGQLGRSGQSCVSDFEPLGQALSDIFSRIAHSKPQPHITISSVIPFIIDSVHRRPDQIKLALSLIEKSVNLADLSDASKLDQIHRSVSKCMQSVFRDDLYQTEIFTFYDKSSVNLHRFTGWSSEYHCLVATLIIRVLGKCSSIARDESIISHISDWLCDDAFYQHVGEAKSLASIIHAEVLSSAREMLLSLRKLTAGSCLLSDREVEELFGLWSKVPELFPNNGDATDFMNALWNSCPSDSASLLRILRTYRDCADGFVSMLTKMTRANRFSREYLVKILAVTDCSSPASFVGLMNDRFGVSTPLLSSEAVGDASVEGTARCLFSHSEAVRKQASLVLWKSLEDVRNPSSAFVNDPLRFCDDVLSDLSQYVLSPMQVDRTEIEQAVSIAVNARLSLDVRTASAVQACTLVSNSTSHHTSSHSLLELVVEGLAPVTSEDLFTALCHLGALLAETESKAALSELVVKRAVMSVFSGKPNRTRCGMLLLNRIVFRDIDRVMLNRIQQVSFHIFSPTDTEAVKSYLPSVSLETIAACVSLYGLRDRSCISTVLPSFEALIRGFDDSHLSGANFDRFIREIIWPSKHAFQHNPAESVRKLFTSCISTLSGIIDSSPMWITDSPDLVLESLDTLSVALGRFGKKLKAPEVHALAKSVISLLSRLKSNEESLLQVRRAGLGLLLVMSEQMEIPLSDLPLRKWVEDPTEKCVFTLQVSLWFFLKMDQRDVNIPHLCQSEDPVVAALAFRLTRSDLDLALVSLENPNSVESLVFVEHCKLVEEHVDAVAFESVIERLERVSDDVRGDAMLRLLVRIATSRGKEIGHHLVSRELWPKILMRPGGLELAIECIGGDERLLVYLIHCGLLKKNFGMHECDSVLTLCRMVRNQLSKSCDCVNRFQPALDWMSSCGDWLGNLPPSPSLFCLVECVSACLLEQSLALVDAHHVIDVLVSFDTTLCNIDQLRAIIQLLRVPGTMVTDVSSESANSILSLLRTHESISLEDSRVSWQIRLISSWAAAASSSVVHQAFSDWYVMMWKRVVLGSIGPTSKNSSLVVRLLTELVCGFLHVLVSNPGSPCWGSPLSEILSFVTSSGSGIPLPLFSLCLSLAEAAAPDTLIGKAVTGRIVSSLMSEYDMERSGIILRFCASLTGCRQAVPEILKLMEMWWSDRDRVDPRVIERLLASIVLAGGHSRRAILSNQQAMDFLVSMENGKSLAAAKTLDVLASTSVRGMHAVVGRRDN
jgi:hypothetical protein